MRRFTLIMLFALGFLTGCDSTWKSSVPAYPVHIVIDTDRAEFVTFKDPGPTEYMVVNRDGFYLNGRFIRVADVTNACGYGGVVVYVNMFGSFDAYDLACPYCAQHGLQQPCTIDGMYAVCPHCGEQYNLYSGTSAPQNGLSHEFMRRLKIINASGRITVTDR